MSQTSPAVRAVIDEVSRAVRRDHRRRMRRRKALRVCGISAVALAGLSTAALAAGGAFREVETITPVGEVELPQNVTIQAVDSFPEFVGKATSNGFATSTVGPHAARYIYHVTGGEARDIGCGYPQVPSNNIYITSQRPLSEQEIRSLLKPDGELEEHAPRPPWITSTSNGCPNPGIAGQPGTPDGAILPGKAAVATPTSTKTHILIRSKLKVPAVSPPAGATTTTTTTQSAGPSTQPSTAATSTTASAPTP